MPQPTRPEAKMASRFQWVCAHHGGPMTNQAAAPTARGLRVQLLGGFRVSSDGRIAGEGGWRLAKARTLVKLLALAPGHRLHRDEVQDLLWPELPWKAASNNFHRALHFARQAVGVPAQYLQLRWGILTLCVDDSIWIDVDEFEAAAAAACRGRDPAMYEAALGLYTGDLLEEWTTQRRSDLRQEYLGLLVALSRLHEGNGELDAAVAALRRVLAAEPAAEEAHAGLMRLHALADRLHESAQQYQALRKALKQHLDTEPAETTERLYQEILDGQLRATATGRAARPAAAVAPASRLTLPHAASSFVGREIEIATVNEMLSATRLLTLVGPAGCGKTRLALRVAADRSHEYRDGAWLTDLGAVQDPDSVARAMARALGLGESPGDRAAAAVAERLRSAETLLMLDT